MELIRKEVERADIKAVGDALRYLYECKAFFRRDGKGQLGDGVLCMIGEEDWEITGKEVSYEMKSP